MTFLCNDIKLDADADVICDIENCVRSATYPYNFNWSFRLNPSLTIVYFSIIITSFRRILHLVGKFKEYTDSLAYCVRTVPQSSLVR